MAGVVDYGAIAKQFLDRRTFEHSFRIEAKVRLSAAQVFHSLEEILQGEDILEIARTDSLSWNIVVGSAEAAKVLRDVGVVDFNGKFFKVVSVSHQQVEIRCHWLPCYVKDEFLRYIFCDFGRVIEVRRETTVLGANLERQNGIRVVVIETDDLVKGGIPHLMKFDNNIAMLITMAGRPPLCLRCKTVGHVRRDCTVNMNYRQPPQRRTYASAVAAPDKIEEPSGGVKEGELNVLDEIEKVDEVMVEEVTMEAQVEDTDGQTKESDAAKGVETEGEMSGGEVTGGDGQTAEPEVQQGVRRSWDDSEGFDLTTAGQLFIDYTDDESTVKRSRTVDTFELMCGETKG